MDERSAMLEAIRRSARPIQPVPADYDELLASIGDRRLVLLGEASHGTHEFYRERAMITQRLIQEKGFQAVAVEADWPDAYRVNRFVMGRTEDQAAIDALADFRRFPAWMWRNADVLDFVGWLRAYNDDRAPTDAAGFYGLDLYSLHTSIDAVLEYLATVDPAAAARARNRYSCFDHFGTDPQTYGYATASGLTESCEDAVVQQLVELRRRAGEYARMDGKVAEDEYFFAEQNARLARNAEAYYRSMFRGRASSWNLRDTHMAETLEALDQHLGRRSARPKIVVWAHNSHLGDARATQMGQGGELNVGQLVREKWGDESFLVGFTTYDGTVTAATDWDGLAERKRVRPGMAGSYESLFHDADLGDFLLVLRSDGRLTNVLRGPLLERAIGVIYRPETERVSHYFDARLSEQFDAVLHFDHTRAVEPLERSSIWVPDEAPHTFPSTL
jgi:erythromycin esterase-like protein